MSAMAKVWHKRILAGTQEYSKCPLKYKEEVKELLILDVDSGVITPERYEEITGEPYPVVPPNSDEEEIVSEEE